MVRKKEEVETREGQRSPIREGELFNESNNNV